MSITRAPDRFTTLPDDDTLAATVVALEEHGFSVEVVADLDAAREAVLARLPDGPTVAHCDQNPTTCRIRTTWMRPGSSWWISRTFPTRLFCPYAA